MVKLHTTEIDFPKFKLDDFYVRRKMGCLTFQAEISVN